MTGSIDDAIAPALRCPRCQGGLIWEPTAATCRECATTYRREGNLVGLITPEAAPAEHTSFYGQDDDARFGRDGDSIDPSAKNWVQEFVASLRPEALVVEIGAGAGAFSGLHPRLASLDISWRALERFCTGPRVQADAQSLPFAAGSVDAIFSVFAIEHIPDPERALAEIDRVLAPGGRALLYPAWLVRPWAAKALDKRDTSDLGAADRLRKLTIPLRNSAPWRFGRILPGRVRREFRLVKGHRLPFDYRPLQPNLDEYLASDSDAFSSMDPHAMSSYFMSRGYSDLRRGDARRRLLYLYEPVEVRKP